MAVMILLKHSKQELLSLAAYPGVIAVLLSTPALMLAPSTSPCFKLANVGQGRTENRGNGDALSLQSFKSAPWH